MRGEPIEKKDLLRWYMQEQKSAADIAKLVGCSITKVHYWLARRGIKTRTLSDASYIKHNPHGDPFTITKPKTTADALLYGIGLGLYWGEGNKRNPTSVRLGNTDPRLIKTYLKFLETCFKAERTKIRFGLQVFSDMNPSDVLAFWTKELGFPKSHFGKVVVTPARSIGTYKEKSKYGVLTVYFSNKKLRDYLVGQIEKL